MHNILNEEIARELLLEINPEISDEEFNKVWEICDGNPWDAEIIYKMVRNVKPVLE